MEKKSKKRMNLVLLPKDPTDEQIQQFVDSLNEDIYHSSFRDWGEFFRDIVKFIHKKNKDEIFSNYSVFARALIKTMKPPFTKEIWKLKERWYELEMAEIEGLPDSMKIKKKLLEELEKDRKTWKLID